MKYCKDWQECSGFDGEITGVDSKGQQVIIVDQYWPVTSGRGSDDPEEQAGNIALILNAPTMYENIKLWSHSIEDLKIKQEMLDLLSKIENDLIKCTEIQKEYY